MTSFQLGTESNWSSARTGVLRTQNKPKEFALPTPCILLSTRSGLPCYLSPEQVKRAQLPKHGYVIDISDLLYTVSTKSVHSSKNGSKPNSNSVLSNFYQHEEKETMEDIDVQGSVHKFLGMNEYFLLIDHRSPLRHEAYSGGKSHIMLNTLHGKQKISCNEYIKYTNLCNGDMYVTPSEDILSNASSSRCSKNVQRTIDFYNEMDIAKSNNDNNNVNKNANKNENKSNKAEDDDNDNSSNKSSIENKVYQCNANIVGVIQGGNDLRQRKKCIENLMKRKFVLNGELGGIMIGSIGFGDSKKERSKIIQYCIEIIKENNKNSNNFVRFVSGCHNFDDIILYVAHGIDCIISAYPSLMTEQGFALMNAVSPENEKYLKSLSASENKSKSSSSSSSNSNSNSNSNENDNKMMGDNMSDERGLSKINIRDLRYCKDRRPLLVGCDCFACKNHSRAYIRHLFNVHELNGHILLEMHNCYRYLKFVDEIRKSIENQTFDKFCQWWCSYSY